LCLEVGTFEAQSYGAAVKHPSQYEEVSMSPKEDTQKSVKSTTAINLMHVSR
jgi:hypothetical protein